MDNRIVFALMGISLTFSAFSVFVQPITAEEEDKPVPGVVYAIWTNPFYFGEVTGSEFVISEWLEDAKIDWKSIKEEKLKETQ